MPLSLGFLERASESESELVLSQCLSFGSCYRMSISHIPTQHILFLGHGASESRLS